MIDKEKVLNIFYATLSELQYLKSVNSEKNDLINFLKGKLQVCSDILGECIPEEYWEQLEELGIF